MHRSRIAAVIFDYGNVLTRTLDPTPRAIWEQRLGLASGELQRLVHNDHSWRAAQLGQITVDAYWHDVGTTLALTPTDTAELRATFYNGDVLNLDLVACIDQLRAAGVQTALLSNFSTELRGLLTAHNLEHRFDQIVISAEIGIMKPEAAAYQAVLDRLQLPAQRCIFIDDHPSNVRAAQMLGIHGILFRDNPPCLTALDYLLTAPA